jgi:hypothetical protein
MSGLQSKKESKNVFTVQHPDYTKSPCSGMTREHWKEAALYLLKGAFSYVKTIDDPMYFPKQEGKSYPRTDSQIPTAKLEGLCRTLFMAAPLLKDNPQLEINGIKVADYYRHQLMLLLDPNSPSYIRPRSADMGPHQNLVEFGGLSVSLFAIPEILWNPLAQAQKDALENLMVSYGDGPTIAQNWKFFNIFILSFYKSQGYKVNEALLNEYVQKALGHYMGDGWYNDNPSFDYYSMWAFQMYGMFWSEYFGKKYYPEYAARFAENYKPLKSNYPYMFARNGEMIMWGRSIAYRFGATAPLPFTGFEKDPSTNYGWMRRIASGALLQFLQNPAYLQDNVPTLGFYGTFEPAIQSYSCRGSVYWCAKAFLGLLLPADNPYWSAVENEGPWSTKELAKGTVANKFEKGANILITDYPNIGAAEIRARCNAQIVNVAEPYRATESYNKLAYNSAFPWQADGDNGEISMNYMVRTLTVNKWEPMHLYTFMKYENGIYYRNAEMEYCKGVGFRLADITLPDGILRVDAVSGTEEADIRLGHYSLPRLTVPVKEESRRADGYDVKIINNGKYQLAMVALKGWTTLETVRTKRLNPVAENSVVIDATDRFTPSKANKKFYITLMLWKKANEKWTLQELVPVAKIAVDNHTGTVTVTMKNGTVKTVKYD